MSNSKTQPREVDVVIETRDVAARFECPHCGCEHRVDMCEFDERGLCTERNATCATSAAGSSTLTEASSAMSDGEAGAKPERRRSDELGGGCGKRLFSAFHRRGGRLDDFGGRRCFRQGLARFGDMRRA